ncbi:MAG TPA: YceD family protein [Burkholderiales bacterium]|jgi:uncharacterized protein|nr:YceD family protein [Burkholderiales bacterium]
MSALPIIDIAEFTRLEKIIDGSIAVIDLPRLKDLVLVGDQTLQYTVRGDLTARREARITCTIHGFVSLECRRCLGAFAHALEIHSTLIFLPDESQLPLLEDEDDSIDYLVGEKTLDLFALIEDEIILALPLAPRHGAGECEKSEGQRTSGGKPSPFAVLAKLKRP